MEPDADAIFTSTGKLKAASFPKLIEILTSNSKDKDMVYNFVLTYRSFSTPIMVMDALAARYASARNAEQRDVRICVLNVLRTWIDKAWVDVIKDGDELCERMVAFLEGIIVNDTAMRRVAETVKSILLRKKCKSGAGLPIQKPQSVGPSGRSTLPRDSNTPLLKYPAQEIAKQLTLIEWSMWEKIQPWEFLDVAWTKKDKEKRSPNILSMIERFNEVSVWVTTTICLLEQPRERAKAIKKFIKIGMHLKDLGNLNGVMEIVSGLNRGPVHRLKQSWEGVSSQWLKAFEELKSITDRQKNMAALRRFLANITPPCIPYLGMYLTDLVFIDAGNANEIGPNKLINFDKRNKISEAIRIVQQYQITSYQLEPVPVLQEMLMNLRVIHHEETLYEISEYLEPRAGNPRPPRPTALGPSKEELAAKSKRPISTQIDVGFLGELECVSGYPFCTPDSSNNLIMDKELGSVKAATLTKLVERLTHPITPDSNSIQPFLATYRSFCTGSQLLDLLISRYCVPPPKDKSPENLERYKAKLQTPVQLRVFNILRNWVDKHWYDFEQDEQLRTKLVQFATGEFAQQTPVYAKALLQSIQRSTQSRLIDKSVPTATEVTVMLPLKVVAECTVLDFNPRDLAQQLAIMQHSLFAALRPYEITDSVYRDQDAEIKAGNAVRLFRFYDTIREWVADELRKAKPEGLLDTVTEQFLDIARCSLQLNDFQTLSAIFKELEHRTTALEALPGRWRQFYSMVSSLLNDDSKLREKLLTLPPPIIPPMVNMLDAIAKHESGKDYINDKLINFEKRRNAGEIIVRLQKYDSSYRPAYLLHSHTIRSLCYSWQKKSYPFANVPFIAEYLTLSRSLSEPHDLTQSFNSLSSSATASTSSDSSSDVSSDDSSDTRIKYLLMDMILHEEQFKQEIRSLVLETFRDEVSNIKSEIRRSKLLPYPVPNPDINTIYDQQFARNRTNSEHAKLLVETSNVSAGPILSTIPRITSTPLPILPVNLQPDPPLSSAPLANHRKISSPSQPLVDTNGASISRGSAWRSFTKQDPYSLPEAVCKPRVNSEPPRFNDATPCIVNGGIGQAGVVGTIATHVKSNCNPSNTKFEDLARKIISSEFPGHTIHSWQFEHCNSSVSFMVVVLKENHYLFYASQHAKMDDIHNIIRAGVEYRKIISQAGDVRGVLCQVLAGCIDPPAQDFAIRMRIKVRVVGNNP